MKLARTAFFTGKLNEDQKEEFYAYMKAEVLPIIRSFPNNLGLQYNIPKVIDPAGPQDLLLMLQHTYDSAEEMQVALSSEQRKQSALATNKILEKLNVSVYHINFERGEL